MDYTKTRYTGETRGLIARERKQEEGVFDIFIETKQLFIYWKERNRLKYVAGWSDISPELLGSVSQLAKSLYSK